MARKSRRDNVTPLGASPIVSKEREGNVHRIPTAIYARLSKEDQNGGETIGNQIAFVNSYISNYKELELVETYVDNGFTGTNFDRPEFNRMIADAGHGKVSCIVVKDLSRFGRNYIEAGMFIETIFPKLNVRLIAVNDNFDSFNESDRNSLTVPMKNMINEMYARDHSIKAVRAYKQMQMDESKLPVGFPPYGYLKNEDVSQYIPDPDRADYVKMMFLWRSLGVSINSILDRLTLIDAPGSAKTARPSNNGKWYWITISKIIENRAYRGDLCFGKYIDRMTNGGRIHKPVDEEKWVVREHTHEPLVTKYDYENIISLQEPTRKKMAHDRMGCFKGILFCKECGRSMISFKRKCNTGTVMWYACYNRTRSIVYCRTRIMQDTLKVIVMDNVKLYLKLMTDKTQIIRNINTSGTGKNMKLSLDKKILAAEVALSEQKEKQSKLYEDYYSGFIEREDFEVVNKGISVKIDSLQMSLNQLLKRKDEYIRTVNNYLTMVGELEYAPGEDGFDPELVRKLIAKIEVTADQRVEITYKSDDISSLIDSELEDLQ